MPAGDILATKVKSSDALGRSEGDMMQYAATHGVLGPRVRGAYGIIATRPIDLDDAPARYVLAHGDLSPRNILVHDGKITGIVDWGKSGFPNYAEYAFAMCLCHQHGNWWIPVLEEVLQPCSAKRLEFTHLVEDRGF
ncbi:hypothetical protein F5B21DRAFT_504968 [Xylaria acuta]|nr:hypothetical protein F5B21DRAFT_504968 [Xylaria acuta]